MWRLLYRLLLLGYAKDKKVCFYAYIIMEKYWATWSKSVPNHIQ
ncbi:hypothetical protein CK5_34310 [Blautia obeum A2-162]|uniref:Uncharacterized protein n=1 Tax=Blautia obeum A2-162 TaxID=657314 RepID=D4LV09_9FIRM|nr:hypothetical protein CK5_34310 [Blautia obeum A2-162]